MGDQLASESVSAVTEQQFGIEKIVAGSSTAASVAATIPTKPKSKRSSGNLNGVGSKQASRRTGSKTDVLASSYCASQDNID